MVYNEQEPHDFALADEHVPVTLRSGENRLMFKIGNIEGRTEMSAHIVVEDGGRLPGINFVLALPPVPTAIESATGQLPPSTTAFPTRSTRRHTCAL